MYTFGPILPMITISSIEISSIDHRHVYLYDVQGIDSACDYTHKMRYVCLMVGWHVSPIGK